MVDRADVVVTVCGHADEQCPALSPSVKKIHWPLSDPAKASGTEDEIMAEFRATRDEVIFERAEDGRLVLASIALAGEPVRRLYRLEVGDSVGTWQAVSEPRPALIAAK